MKYLANARFVPNKTDQNVESLTLSRFTAFWWSEHARIVYPGVSEIQLYSLRCVAESYDIPVTLASFSSRV